MIQEVPNTLTRQSACTTDFPRDPLHVPITWNPVNFMDTLRLHLCLQYRHIIPCCNYHNHTAVLRAYPLPHLIRHRDPRCLRCHFWWSPFLTWFDSPFATWSDSRHSPRFNSQFSIWLDSKNIFDLIQLTFNIFIFDSVLIIWISFQSVFRESHIG